jgi:hypothetical protein
MSVLLFWCVPACLTLAGVLVVGRYWFMFDLGVNPAANSLVLVVLVAPSMAVGLGGASLGLWLLATWRRWSTARTVCWLLATQMLVWFGLLSVWI